MSGGLLLWIIVLVCWSMSFQLMICRFIVMPVFALYVAANAFQNAAVWSLLYSAMTTLI